MCCAVKSFTCKVTSYLNRSETKKKTNQRSLGENPIVCLSGRAACFHFNLRYVNIAHSLCDVTQSRILQNMKTSHCYKDHRLNLFFFFFFFWALNTNSAALSLKLTASHCSAAAAAFQTNKSLSSGPFLSLLCFNLNELFNQLSNNAVCDSTYPHTHTHTHNTMKSHFSAY